MSEVERDTGDTGERRLMYRSLPIHQLQIVGLSADHLANYSLDLSFYVAMTF